MRQEGIRPRHKRRFKRTTDSSHRFPVAANLLNRLFEPSRPNETWVPDITYVWTREGWLYLALVVDLFSRMIVGWAQRDRMSCQLVIGAFNASLRRECHSQHWFLSLEEAQRILEACRADCSNVRPLSALVNKAPAWHRQGGYFVPDRVSRKAQQERRAVE